MGNLLTQRMGKAQVGRRERRRGREGGVNVERWREGGREKGNSGKEKEEVERGRRDQSASGRRGETEEICC